MEEDRKPPETAADPADRWKEELARLVEARAGAGKRPRERRVGTFLSNVVVPAFEELASALQEHDRDVEVEIGPRDAAIRILHDEEEDFYFSVEVESYRKRDFSFPVIPLKDVEGRTFRAEAHLKERPLERDVTDCSKEELIRIVLEEYGRHLRWHL